MRIERVLFRIRKRGWNFAAAYLALKVVIIAAFIIFLSDKPFFSFAQNFTKDFNKNQAFEFLQTQCDFGPRNPGSTGHAKELKWLKKILSSYCDAVFIQNFTQYKYKLTNVIGIINPQGKPVVMLAAHWDTRPTADYEETAEKRKKPIPGANDGASGVAVLLETARVLHNEKPSCCVIFTFFDGEDLGPGSDRMYLGSKYFAEDTKFKQDYAIVVDMVGKKDLKIFMESNSLKMAPEFTMKIFSIGKEVSGKTFVSEEGFEIIDDHIPLNKAGIPTVLLIDFSYRYWHTLSDTPDKCSPDSLEAVGKVLLEFVRTVK